MHELRLSTRQMEVISLVAAGCSDKEIAGRLGLSIGTVKTYLGRIYRHNDLRNRAQAVAALAGMDLDIMRVPRLSE